MQELTLFGGLAKAQTHQQIEVGVWKSSASASLSTINLSLSIISYRKDYLEEHPDRNDGLAPIEDGDWRNIVLNSMVRRSFEIWPRLKFSDVLRGLGLNTRKATSSVGGKIGTMKSRKKIIENGEYWELISNDFHSQHINLNSQAIAIARSRAKAWRNKST